MPKLVCVSCHCELCPETTGTTVIETASFGPYKVWEADTWKCPVCGVEIVAGFANFPLRDDHYSKDFAEWLEKVKVTSRRIEYDNECPISNGHSNDDILTSVGYVSKSARDEHANRLAEDAYQGGSFEANTPQQGLNSTSRNRP